jgi:hypothetical protein
MLPSTLDNAYRREDLLREAAHERLVNFVQCCAKSSLFAKFSDTVSRVLNPNPEQAELIDAPENICCTA